MEFTLFESQTTGSQDSEMVCSKGFFYDANVSNTCRPLCGEFNPTSHFSLIILAISSITGIIATVVVIINAITVQRKKL